MTNVHVIENDATPRMAYMYVTDLPSIFFTCSSLRERHRFLQPIGNYSIHVWVQVQCKAVTVFPTSESRRVEAQVGSCSRLRNARHPRQSDRRGIKNMLPDDDSGD